MVGIIGNMSGGKTYTAVSYMLEYLKENKIVATNIRLKCKGVTDYLKCPCVLWKQNYYYLTDKPSGYHEIEEFDFRSYPHGVPRGHEGYKENLVYLFFDEASSLWDSLTSVQNQSIQDVAAWARHTEKRGQIVYLLAQFPSEIHKRLRNHILEYHACKNSATVRLPIIRCHLPYFMRDFILTTVIHPDTEEILQSTVWRRIDSRIYNCYDTSQIVVGSSIPGATSKAKIIEVKESKTWIILNNLIIACSLLQVACLLVLLLRRV